MKTITRIAAVVLIALTCGTAAAQNTETDKSCPKVLQVRSLHQIVNAHITLFDAGAARDIACNYDQDAILVLPGMVATGRAQIETAYASLFDAFGPDLVIEVMRLTESGEVAVMEYAIVKGDAIVMRGVDTFVVQAGLVKVQTHSNIEPAALPTASFAGTYEH